MYLRFAIVLLAIVSFGFSRSTQADVVITNLVMTETTLSFDIAGTIDAVGANNPDSFFIGEPGNTSWILSTGTPIHGTWTSTGGTHASTSGAINNLGANGQYVYSWGGPSMVVSDTVQASFLVTGASFDPDAVDLSQWIVTVGYDNAPPLPDAGLVTGYVDVAPEPTSFVALCMGMVLVGARRRRHA